MHKENEMDKNLLYNIYIVLIKLRADIQNTCNMTLATVAFDAVKNKIDNAGFYNSIMAVVDANETAAYKCENGEMANISKSEFKIITTLLRLICRELEGKNYTYAYDLCDVLHVLPESLSCGKNINIRRYIKTYIKPLCEKYDDSELRDLVYCGNFLSQITHTLQTLKKF